MSVIAASSTSSTSVSTVLASTPKTAKEQLFQKIADVLKVQMESIRNGQILRFSFKGVTKQIVGYSFPLNDAAAARSCSDKTSTSAILEADKIPLVEHILPSECNPAEFGQKHNYNLVCKPKDGRMGIGVTRITNPKGLQAAIAQTENPCLSPYYEIESEYRVVMLNFAPQIIFEKVKPHIVGNGVSTVAQLIGQYYLTTPPSFLQKMKDFNPAWLPLTKVLKQNETMHLQWKHSVFTARVLNADSESSLIQKINQLATAAAKSLGIVFACVDVISLETGEIKVLEVNSTVFVENHEIGATMVTKIYQSAIALMLGIPSASSDD